MIAALLTDDLVLGAAELEQVERGVRPHRLPRAVRQRDADPQLAMMEAQPSGVRIAARTTAVQMVLEVHTTRMTYRGVMRDRGAVDVVVNDSVLQSHVLSGGDTVEIDPTTGTSTVHPGTTERITLTDLPAGGRRSRSGSPTTNRWIWSRCPLMPFCTRRRRADRGGCTTAARSARDPTPRALRASGLSSRPVVPAFGCATWVSGAAPSSIRSWLASCGTPRGRHQHQAGHQRRQPRCYAPSFVRSRSSRVPRHRPRRAPDHTAAADLADPLRDPREHSGTGAIDPDSFAAGSARFRATGTEGDIALGRLTLRVIRDALAQIVDSRSDDPNLHHLDGLLLFGEDDERRQPLPDNLHPDTDAHAVMGQRFADIAFGPSGPFAPTTTDDVPDDASRG